MYENGAEENENLSKWTYNAPQYVDFKQISAGLDEANVEDYFNYDHEANPGLELFAPPQLGQFNTEPTPDSTTDNKIEDLRSHTESDDESSNTRGEASDTIASPHTNRGRSRVILEVNEDRKRLSMSVDRGKDRFRSFAHPPRNSSKNRSQHSLKLSNEESETATTSTKPPVSRSIQSLRDEKDIVAAITEGVSEEVRLEAACSVKQVGHKGVPMKPSSNNKLTLIQPFSFEKRDRQMLAKREEFVRKFIAEEKKAREFKAQPFPELLYSDRHTKALPQRSKAVGASYSQTHAKSVPQNSQQTFKAKPATVLQKNPFKPVKAQHNIVESASFQLSTQQRAQKRAEWDKYIKEKEQQRDEQRQLTEKRKQAEEEAMVKKLRAKLVHKPLPVPHFKQPAGNDRPPASDKENNPSTQKKQCKSK